MPSTPPSGGAQHLSGIAVLSARRVLEDLVGVESVSRGLASVSESARNDYEAASPISWVLHESVIEVHEAIAREAGEDIEQLALTVTEMSVDRLFGSVWRIFLRFVSDETIISRTPLMYSRTRSLGSMSARIVSPGIAEAEISGWPTIPDRDIAIHRVAIQRFLALAGRRATVRAERTPSGARYRVQWRE